LRADWRHEREAELNHRELLLAEWDRLDSDHKFNLLWRSTSAFWDAMWMQTYRWEDAMIQDLRFGMRMLLKRGDCQKWETAQCPNESTGTGSVDRLASRARAK